MMVPTKVVVFPVFLCCVSFLKYSISESENRENCKKGKQYWSVKDILVDSGTCAACPPDWKTCNDQSEEDKTSCLDSCHVVKSEKPKTQPKTNFSTIMPVQPPSSKAPKETKKTTAARPTPPLIKTTVPKHDQTRQSTSTTNPPRTEIKSTRKLFKITTKKFAKKSITPTAEKPGNTSVRDDPSAHSVRLAICIAVLATFVVFLIVAVIYFWRRSSISIVNEKSSEEERIEMCDEPSTSGSSHEPSPVVKRLRSEQSSDNEETRACVPPAQATETGKLISAIQEAKSKLNLEEEES